MTKDQIIKQACVLTLGSGWECYYFAQDVEGADIEALQARVLEIGNGWECYYFARDIKGADIQALQARINKLKEI